MKNLVYSYSFLIFCVVFTSCVNFKNEDPAATKAMQDSSFVQQSTPVFHASHEPKKADAPFSDVIQVGNTYYLSGQIGMDHSTRALVAGGIEAETQQTIENIKQVLAQHGMGLTNVVKCLVVLDDIENFSAFNSIYESHFPQKPARTTFAAAALARGATIEIEVIAIK